MAEPHPAAAGLSDVDTARLIAAGQALLQAASGGTIDDIKRLLKPPSLSESKSKSKKASSSVDRIPAPTWYQEPETGWSALHYAAERGDSEIVGLLLRHGAVWNAVDNLGNTAGDISLSINDQQSYMMIRNEGLRTEILHYALAASNSKDDEAEEQPEETATEQDITTTTASGSLTLRHTDSSSAGSNLAFLSSKLIWSKGEDGRERVLDADGNGVMMGWEEPLMIEHVKRMCDHHPDVEEDAEGMSILNVGFGLGIIDRLFQNHHKKPKNHVIIEAHPQVLQHIKDIGFDKIPGVVILAGRWQDWINEDKIGHVIGLTEGSRGFGGVFVDTFAEGYEDLKAFFEFVPDLLDGPEASFSFWNGLGATNPTIYDVASNLAEFHLEDVGMQVEWHDVAVDNATAEEVWNGVRRKYWTLPVYRLPVARMNI